ncbi:MAG: NAD(P)H-binding protein [Mycobacterium sp.]
MRILVTGSTGYIGSRLVTELLAEGHQVLAASRDPARLGRLGWCDDVTAVALDASDPASTRAAFAVAGPVDLVYYLVHGIGQPGYRDADNAAAANVAAAAQATDVPRIVYLGGFVPEGDGTLSEHLTSRAEVAAALDIDGGPEVVWLGAAMILGAGSTSFEMLRYVGDRFLLAPLPAWMDNPIDPISIRDVLYYLVAAGNNDAVPAGAYDICGPDTTTYRGLLTAYAQVSGRWRARFPVPGIGTGLAAWVSTVALPAPGELAGELVMSLDHPMLASDRRLRDLIPDPTDGLISSDDAITRALASQPPRPVNVLTDPHHLADSDPGWTGGDALRIRRLAKLVVPPLAWPALGLVDAVPGPVVGLIRTGLDTLINLTPRGRSA